MKQGVVWEDLRLGASHFGSFERVAVVTDIDWIEHAARNLGMLIPGQIRAFLLADREAGLP